MIRRPPRSTQSRSSAASDVYKRQALHYVLFALSNLHITPDGRRDLVYAASATGSLYRSPLAIMAQAMRAILLASPMLGAMDLGIADDGERTGDEQAAQIAVTLLADTAEPVLAPA